MVRIRLKRVGRRHVPCFRIVSCDARSPRDGRVLEILGTYQPDAPDESKQIVLKRDRIDHWLARGAVPSETVASIFRNARIDLKKSSRDKRKRASRTRKPKAAGKAEAKAADE